MKGGCRSVRGCCTQRGSHAALARALAQQVAPFARSPPPPPRAQPHLLCQDYFTGAAPGRRCRGPSASCLFCCCYTLRCRTRELASGRASRSVTATGTTPRRRRLPAYSPRWTRWVAVLLFSISVFISGTGAFPLNPRLILPRWCADSAAPKHPRAISQSLSCPLACTIRARW